MDHSEPEQDKSSSTEAPQSPSPPTPPEKPKRKSVGFAPLPEEDLKEHHENLKKIEESKKNSIPFHQIPPELSYLQKFDKPAPKPLPTGPPLPPKPVKPHKVLGDLKKVHVKDISVINKDTELNFNYPTIELPIPSHNVLVSIKYAGLNSFDISKLNKYYFNLSDVKVGLGYEFVGQVVDIGATAKQELSKGDYVMGILSPTGRKGAFSSTVLLNPTKDFLVQLDDLTLDKLAKVDPYLEFSQLKGFSDDSSESSESDDQPRPSQTPATAPKRKTALSVEDELPALAKAATIPVLYCKAKQALQHLKPTEYPNLMINGADTNLGYTLIQMLSSSLYEFERLNLVLVVKESRLKQMRKWVRHLKGSTASDGEMNFEVVSYDLENEDIVLPGEKIPINYKKPDLMAVDVLEAMFKNSKEKITAANIDNYKFDLIVDITGSHYLQKTSIRYKKLDYLNFPVVDNLDDDTKLSTLLKANVKDQFFIKLMKPKSQSSGLVSFCKFTLKEPSYSIDTLIDYSTQASEQSILNPWSSKWSSGIANSLLRYNYYDEINLTTTRPWIIEGLNLFLKNEIKFQVDHYIDWRNNFKQYIKDLRKHDGKVVMKVEDF
ncbi:hypothetical protein PSN45_003744 [Yamadazyma tenuis]|uniref:Alcohol dehydrogenase-like N-terminal domain-containing protein n=1 Tax=Candida tenuis (strain ATCC 10573 / BCRC 21748 / CBS 615 / JCM 9827 / NBRC 10315 / NRRL Y-1498 / VKM Y-70) TaxID=590646 RepID=G3B3E9_CANTC|nr:uncharacterized protein CANTEDRAFT_105591 [Yamadazyma tenuis ATCC 10573]EGV64150.1 hypothetical protein CANTEDRAFT_105591 [Yamadazyma tenuis ATCC 10573]WEJ96208.1 hypothetical protein PSN45_003744 [Yamadazyma tenuis]